MIIIGDSLNKSLSKNIGEILGADVIYPEITVFPDTEQRVRIDAEKIQGEDVYLVKSVEMPVDNITLQLSFLVDAAIRAGANRVVGVIPYLPYMRADHVFRTGEAVPLEIIIKLLESAGLAEIIIVDPHSIKTPELFNIKAHNLTALNLFAKKILEIEPNRENITIVSPDMGGLRRIELLDEALGGGVNQVYINKERDYESGHVSVAEYKGDIRGVCFIIDDIIATGKTIAQAVQTLQNNGAEAVYVFGTHPVFSEGVSDLLQKSDAVKVFVTDSIPVTDQEQFSKLEIISLATLISEHLQTFTA